MDAEHRWLAKTEPGAGGRPASVEKGLGRDHFSFSYSQAIVYTPAQPVGEAVAAALGLRRCGGRPARRVKNRACRISMLARIAPRTLFRLFRPWLLSSRRP